ncbi:MAG TPA: hypothetical protein EYO61_00210 [Campylobacterales bacterium]|nr:hypothetical protein [Campylobacterales bacterium]
MNQIPFKENLKFILRKLVKKYLYYRFIDLLINRKKFFRDIKEDIKTLLGKYNYPYRKILIIALPKSGSTWVENFIYKINGYVARRIWGDEEKILRHQLQEGSFKNFSDKLYSYAKLHIDPTPENIELLNKSGIEKILILYRDPRDVAVSRYFHFLKYPKRPWEPHYLDYHSIPKADGISHSVDLIIDELVPWIDGWLEEAKRNPDKYLVLRYEDILADKIEAFSKIVQFFKLGKSKEEIEKILDEVDREMKKGFNLKSTAGNKSTFRKGGSGDWKNHFSERDIEKFKQIEEKLNKFGYYF